jgi:IgA Peptidase M64/Secretion system C-terminal sorting domain
MKSKILLLVYLGLSQIVLSQSFIFPVQTIVDNGQPNKRVKFVFLGDGFTSAQQTDFIDRVTTFSTNLFTQEPFKTYKNFFNIYAIKVPSNESGADHPNDAGDDAIPQTQPTLVADTYFDVTFDYAKIHRLVYPKNFQAVFDVLTANFPSYNQSFIFSNSIYYGGAGGDFATSTVNKSSDEVAIHEIGHSFAILADEYEIGGQGERANRTKILPTIPPSPIDPLTIRWRNWIGSENIDVFPIGIENWYRPHQNCKMQFLGVPFCAVCKEAFVDKMYSIVTPIYSYLPSSTTPTISTTTNFSTNLTLPVPNTLATEWKLNGATIATGLDNVDINPAALPMGNSTLTIFVTDKTPLSRSYRPASGYVFSQTWNITRGALPLEWLNFDAKREQNHALLTWQTAQEQNVSHFEVQRSYDGKNFQSIGFVKAQNRLTKSDYRFVDNSTLRGATYYRIEQFDNDKKSTFSPIRTLEKSDKFYYKISPNPASDVVNISGNTDYNTKIKIEMYNALGAKVYDYALENVENTYQHEFSVRDLPNGAYILVLNLQNGFSIKEQILKVD